jgi:hypothetical protein
MQPEEPTINWQMITPARLAWIMAVGETTVTEWNRKEEIKRFRKGRLVRYKPAEVLAFIARNSTRSKAGRQISPIAGQAEDDAKFWARIERLIADQVKAQLVGELLDAA